MYFRSEKYKSRGKDKKKETEVAVVAAEKKVCGEEVATEKSAVMTFAKKKEKAPAE